MIKFVSISALVFSIAIYLLSCDSTGNKNGTQFSANSLDTCAVRDTHLIDTAKALDYLIAFMNENMCCDFTTEYGIGNYYPIENLPLPTENVDSTDGIFIYHCFDRMGETAYCALRFGKVCDPKNADEFTIASNSQLPVSSPKLLHDCKPGLTRINLFDYLKETTLDASYLNYVPDTLAATLVNMQRQQFITQFSEFSNFTSVSCGFFNLQEFTSFINQTANGYDSVGGFVILRGLDNRLTCDKMRTLLIAIDKQGRFMIDHDALILERSWPPRKNGC